MGHRTPLLDWAARKEAIDLASSTPSVRPPPACSNSGTPSHASSQLQGADHASGSPRVDRDAGPHPNGLLSWWRDRNTYSLDGLPALDVAFRQSPSSLGHHQAVRKARQSALNAYPPSKQPVEDSPKASDIRSGRPWALTLWLIHLVRWFILFQLVSPIITSYTTFVTRLLAKPGPAKAPITTIRIHGEEIHETSSEGTELLRPPVSWGVDDMKKDHNLSATRVSALERRATCERLDKDANTLGRLIRTGLLGHGVSFLLGMMFMVFYRDVHSLASVASHAAASLSLSLAFKA